MPKEDDVVNLQVCLDQYTPERLFIRLVGSRGGDVKVNESLEGKTLGFRNEEDGWHLLIDTREVFHFPLDNYQKGFSLAYERITPTEDGIGRRVMLGTGENPYDPELPEPRRSILRNVLDEHLLEIYFKGRVDVRFHSWWETPHWKYWTITPPYDRGDG